MRVIIDSREKTPININLNNYITEVCVAKLDTGDYSIDTLQDKVAIERKASINEIVKNITEDRMWNVIDRLEKIEYSIIVCEFPLSDIYTYPESSGLSQKIKSKLKITPQFILSSINHIIMCGIPIIFAGDKYHAEKFINDFLCKIIKKHGL